MDTAMPQVFAQLEVIAGILPEALRGITHMVRAPAYTADQVGIKSRA